MITREHARRATEHAPQISDEQIRRAWRDHREGQLHGWRTPPAIVDSSTRGPHLVGTSTWVRPQPQTVVPRVVSVKSYDLQAMRAEMLLTSIPVAQTNTGGSYTSASQMTIPLDPEAQSNDVVILYVQTAAQSLLTPTGWTAILTETVGTGGAAGATALSTFYRRINQRTDDNTAALNDSGDHQFAVEIVVRGCVESGNPIDISSGGTLGIANTAVSIPTATTVTNNCLVLAAVGHAVSSGQKLSGWTNANLSNVAELYDNSAISGSVAGGIGIGMGGLATAGATGATTATLATLSNQALITLALKPAANSGIALGNPTVAPPYYVAQSTATSVDSGAGTSIAWPAGHASNDIALLFIQTPNVAVASVSGFNFACTGVTGSANTSGAVMGTLYWARATSGSMPATTILLSSPSSTVVAAVMVAVRGAYALGTPFQGTPSAAASASSTTVTYNGSPATADNLLRVWGVFNATSSASPQTSGETATTVADFTEVADYNVANGGSNGGGGVGVCFGTNGPTGQNLTANPALTATLANASVSVDITALLLPSSFTGQALASAIGAETDGGLIQLAGTTPLASDVTTSDYSSVGSLQLSWPSVLQVNDIGILLVQTNAQASTVFPLVSTNTVSSGGAPISAFSAITNTPQTTGSAGVAGAVALSAFWCRATAADVLLTSLGAPGVIINDSGVQQVAVLLVYRGCVEYDNPWDVTAGSAATTNTSVSIPGATTTTNNCVVVAAVANATSTTTQQASGWTNASLSDLFEVIDLNTTVGNGGGISAAQGRLATAGVYSATTATLSSTSAQAKFSVALKPAVAKYGTASPFVYQSGVVTSQAVAGANAVTMAWPANHQANDVALLYVETENETPSLSTPSGFALLSNQGTGTANASGSTGLWIYWCRATTSAQASVVIAAATGHLVVGLHTFRNCITTGNPWEDVQGTVASVASTTATLPAVTTTEPNAFVLQCCAGAVATTGVTAITNSGLSGMAVTRNSGSALGNTPGHTLVVASDKSGAAGSTGTTTATITSTKQALISIAFKAAPRSSAGSTAGTATSLAVGAGTAAAPGSAAGIAAATAVGFGSTASVGAAAGTATATAVGVIPVVSAVGAAAGTATATGVGASTAAAPATAAGTATATAVGTGIKPAIGEIAGASLTKTGGTNSAWNAGAASVQTLTGDGYVEVLPKACFGDVFVGLSIVDTNLSFSSIKYAWYINGGVNANVYENGSTILGGQFLPNDRLRIRRTGTTITYETVAPDGTTTVRYTSLVTTAAALIIDTSLDQLTPTPAQLVGIRLFSAGTEVVPIAWQNASTVGITTQYGAATATATGASTAVAPGAAAGTATPTAVGASTAVAPGAAAGTATPTAVGASTAAAKGIGVGALISKNAGGSAWNAGASSVQTIAGDGYVEWTGLDDVSHVCMIGLSAVDADQSYTSIDYALYAYPPDPSVDVYESGSIKFGTITQIAAGDIYRVQRSGTTVTYKRNGVTFYTSLVSSSGALRVDSSFNQVGTSAAGVRLFDNGTEVQITWQNVVNVSITEQGGSSTAAATGKSTAAAPGAAAGTATPTGVGASTATAAGAAAGTATATTAGIGVNVATGAAAGSSTATATGKSTAVAPGAAAGTATPTGVGASTATTAGEATGWLLTRTAASTGQWDTGASSVQTIAGDGYVEWTVPATLLIAGRHAMAGLSAVDPDQNWTSILFGCYATPQSGGQLYAAESGSLFGSFAVPGVGDVLRVQRVGTTITYLRNGVIYRTSLVSSSGALRVDTAFDEQGASLVGIRFVDNGKDLSITWQNAVGVSTLNQGGSSTATATGKSTAVAPGTAAGTATPTGVGASTATAAGAAAGTSAATATGKSTAVAPGTAAGTATPTGVGASTATAVGAAAGTATPTGVGASTATAAGAAAGTATPTGVGAATDAAAGAAAGSSITAATGTGINPTTGATAGSSTAAAVGQAITAGTGAAAGSSTDTAAGIALGIANATSTGVATAHATSAPQNLIHTADASATTSTSVDADETVHTLSDDDNDYSTDVDYN